MPAPPPYGESSTVRCRSEVQVRRSWILRSTIPFSMALPVSDRCRGWKYSTKIETMSIFIDILEILEQAGNISDGQAACLKINVRYQCSDERDQPRAVGRLDLQHFLARQVQHRVDGANDDSIRPTDLQPDQLPVVELLRFEWPVLGLDGGDQQRPAYGLGSLSVGNLGESDQQPAGMITNRLHRERSCAALVTEHLTGGETPFRLVSTELDGDLTAYAVRPPYDADDGLSAQLLTRAMRSASTATGTAASDLVDIDEIDANILAPRQGTDHRAQSGRGASGTTDDLADVLGIDPHLEHPPATQFLVLDGDIVRMRD